MSIEYMPFYAPGEDLRRCQSCGALISSGDTELHTRWHEQVEVKPSAKTIVKGVW